jgi:hypothetical protein
MNTGATKNIMSDNVAHIPNILFSSGEKVHSYQDKPQ